MEFNINSPLLFVMVGVVIAAVLAQSVFFLIKAMRRAKEIGMESVTLKKVIRTAALFTVAPAIAIVISVITLAKDLGIPLPWLRLSVVGSLSYEMVAAANAESGMGLEFGKLLSPLTVQQYVTIALVMTISILVGVWLAPIIGERLQNGMLNIEKRDKKWGEILTASMFIGMISAFIGFVFCDFSSVFKGDTSGLIPVLVFFVSAAIMAGAGILVKKTNWRWISDYALPISLILGMASAIPLTAWLG